MTKYTIKIRRSIPLSASLSALFFCCLLLGVQASQEEGPVLRAPQGQTVLVDVVVTDRRNRLVSDLALQDFTLLEDGVPQQIDSFQLIQPGSPVERPSAGGIDAEDTTAIADSPRERPNLIVFLLDYASTEFTNQNLVRDACAQYVRKNLRPNDAVAVFSLSTGFRFLQDFTNNKELLLAAFEGGTGAGNSVTSSPAAATLPGTGFGVTPSADVPQDAAGGQAAQAGGSAQADEMLAERIQQLYYTMTSFVSKRETYAVLGAIQAISRGVENIEGRKTLLLFSQGFVVGPHMEPELEKTVSMANRANLAIYGVDSQGLATRDLSGELVPGGQLSSISSAQGPDRVRATGGESLFDRARQVGTDVRETTLRFIAGATGGFTVRNSNDLHSSLERIDEEARSYYLLAYRSNNLELDGGFREIKVEVDRKGVEVRARSGYIALPPGMDLLEPEEFQLVQEISQAEKHDLPIYFRLDRFQRGTREVPLFTLELAGESIRFEPSNDQPDKVTADLTILGLVRDSSGRLVSRFGSPVKLHATPDERAALEKGGLRFSNQLTLDPGSYSFEVLVRDNLSARTGRFLQGLALHRPTQAFSLSSIVLGREVDTLAQDDSDILVHDGTRIRPMANRKFRPDDRLIYFLEVYDGQPEENSYQVEVAIGPAGSPNQFRLPTYELPGHAVTTTSKYVDLPQLSPGQYWLTVDVTSSNSGQKVRRRTSFAVAGSGEF